MDRLPGKTRRRWSVIHGQAARMSVPKIREDLKPNRSTSLLPPCQVCERKATGLHYGQYTCEACKGFFRRSIGRTQPYTSDCSGTCKISPDQTKLCPSCRYRKCLLVGMSISGIKIGRYTHNRRTHNTLEVKKIQQTPLTTAECLEEPSIPKSPKPWMSLALDEIIRNIVEGHDEIIKRIYTREEDIEEKHRICYEEHKLKLEIFGQRATLSKDEYDEMYESTGIDIDGRQDLMRNILEQHERRLREFVGFVKLIPQFDCLSIVDQAGLVKSSCSEFILLENFQGVNNEMQVCLFLNQDICFHFDELKNIYQSDVLKFWSHTAESLQKLKLKHEEIVILETVCVLSSDRCSLQEPGKIDDLQWKMIQCLMYLLEKNHENASRMFPLVIERLSAMRGLMEYALKIIPAILLWPCLDKYPLYSEIIRSY